ncbi:MAG: hypothetical protein WA431_15335 [Candidatus Cybelea sp.]
MYVYDYRKQTLVGTLTGFNLPAERVWKYPAGGDPAKVFWPGSGGPEAQTVSFPR